MTRLFTHTAIMAAILLMASQVLATSNDSDLNPGRMVLHTTYGSSPTCTSATTNGSICAQGGAYIGGNQTIVGNLAISGNLSVGGSTSNAGIWTGTNSETLGNETNNVFTFTQSGGTQEDLLLTAGSNMWTWSSTTSAAMTVTPALTVTGVMTASTGFTAMYPALATGEIRFCGNGFAGATAHYMGPAPSDEGNYVTGGSSCDALDDATIGNVDDAWPRSPLLAFYPVSMTCSGICTGATAANDAVVFLLYDDTVAVAAVTCTFTFAGDATPNQCTVKLTAPTLVAANSLLAVKVTGTNDACSDAGDDFECIMKVAF
jgi:hypothetical protein